VQPALPSFHHSTKSYPSSPSPPAVLGTTPRRPSTLALCPSVGARRARNKTTHAGQPPSLPGWGGGGLPHSLTPHLTHATRSQRETSINPSAVFQTGNQHMYRIIPHSRVRWFAQNSRNVMSGTKVEETKTFFR
jgi:hypothetical protein